MMNFRECLFLPILYVNIKNKIHRTAILPVLCGYKTLSDVLREKKIFYFSFNWKYLLTFWIIQLSSQIIIFQLLCKEQTLQCCNKIEICICFKIGICRYCLLSLLLSTWSDFSCPGFCSWHVYHPWMGF